MKLPLSEKVVDNSAVVRASGTLQMQRNMRKSRMTITGTRVSFFDIVGVVAKLESSSGMMAMLQAVFAIVSQFSTYMSMLRGTSSCLCLC